MADLGCVSEAIRIGIAGIEDQTNGLPADGSAAQPDQGPQPPRQLSEVEHVARRQRVEVAGKQMKSVLVPREARQQIPQLDDAMPFSPRRVQRAQVQTEDPQISWPWIDLEKCMTRQPRVMPLEMPHRAAAHESKRLPF